MTKGSESHYFTEDSSREWRRIGEQHRLRDELFLRRLEAWLRPGPVLEIGAATGHLSAILQSHGRDVTASDISPRFVAACAQRGLNAKIVDATRDIRSQTGQTFANVLAQNVLPLIRRDLGSASSALAAIHAGLQPEGRLICSSAHAWRTRHPELYYSPRQQIELARTSGLYRIVTVFPHQVVPTALYRSWNARLLNFLDFQAAKIAAVRLIWVAERIG